jgi:Fic family protein
MAEFFAWLKNETSLHAVAFAAEAHYRLVTIHPFVDGNGRTARLLMNMILMMNGYPPAIIRKNDRLAYIASLEKSQLAQAKEGSKNDYLNLIAAAVDRSLTIYLKAVTQEDYQTANEKLLKIGALAKLTQQTNSTIRHWTKEGLLQVADITPSGYQMYDYEMVERVQKILELREKRLTLSEIKVIIKS